MRFVRTLAVAAATAVVSLGAGPIADAAHATKPGAEPCAKQEQKVAKAQEALAQKQHVKKDKLAQLQRLAKAEERLAACQAGKD